MFKEAPKPNAEQLAEIERLKADIITRRQSRAESFERSDTDGFLSQWADGISAEKYQKEIAILENGGCAEFPVLCDENGEVVANKIYYFADKYRPDQWNNPKIERWRLPDELAEKLGRKWIPVNYYSDSKSRVQKKLGLHEEKRWFPAIAKIVGRGNGLSGAANAYVTVCKKEENN